MPDERKALVEARSRLQRELLAVEARETKLLSALAQRSVDEFHRDWQAHVAAAEAAHVDPFYLPGHEGLIGRLQELRRHPAVEELPERERNWIDSILGQDTRRTEAASHVHEYLAQVQRCCNELEELRDLARTHKSRLEEVLAYDEWHATAERLLCEAQAILGDRKTFGPCLDHTFMTWHKVNNGIRDLTAALGHPADLLLCREPELYLQPIPRALPIFDKTLEADASYRRLREQWHKLVASAETDGLHPYDLDGHSQLIEAMRALLDRQPLHAIGRRSLDTILSHHGEFVQTRADIEQFRLDWQRRLDRAEAAHAHPCYVPGHRSLIERLEPLVDGPAFAALPRRPATGAHRHSRPGPQPGRGACDSEALHGMHRALPRPAGGAADGGRQTRAPARQPPLLRALARDGGAPPCPSPFNRRRPGHLRSLPRTYLLGMEEGP